MDNDNNVDVEIQLQAFNIGDYTVGMGQLYVSGPALQSGFWHDSLDNYIFYPTEVIQKAAPLFKGCDLVCEHKEKSIGTVTDVALSASGFSIDGVVTNHDSINAIINKEKLGFSIKARVKYDPITHVATEIHEISNIALVGSPACKTCVINKAKTNEGLVIMSEANSEAETKTDTETVEESTATTEVEASAKIDEVKTEEAATESPTSTAPSVNNVSINNVMPEQPLNEVMATLSSATATVEKISDQLKIATSTIQELTTKYNDANVELSAQKAEVAKYKTEIEGYQSRISSLQSQLNAKDEMERSTIITDIKTLDPEVNTEFIESMTTVQLSSYRNNIKRIAGTTITTRKSTKADEASAASPIDTPAELSAKEVPVTKKEIFSKDDTIKSFMSYLSNSI